MTSFPRLTANTATFSCSFGQVAAVARHAGFAGLEIWSQDLDELDGGADRAAEILAGEGLGVSALQVLRDFEGAPEDLLRQRLGEAEALMDLTRRVGADTLLVCANTLPDSGGDTAQLVVDLRGLADMAAERALRIAFEPLVWSQWINRYETAWPLIEAVNHPALGLTLDAFHLFHQGTPAQFVRRIPRDKLFLVQICDAAPAALPPIQIARHHRLFAGEGVWPIADLLKVLTAVGYDGFYNIEVFNDAYRADAPQAIARRAFETFFSVFERARA